MLAHEYQFSAETTVRRTRMLPDKGRVLVNLDQEINALDAVAESRYKGRHLRVDAASQLNLNSIQHPGSLIIRKAGDRVRKGDVLAEKKGIFHRVLRSPVSGEIVSVHNGQIILKILDSPKKLLSGFNGVVTEIIPDRGVVVEGKGALIQGGWANGHICEGTLVSVMNTPADEFTKSMVKDHLRGKVILGGYCRQEKALEKVSRLPINGLILASMSAALIPIIESMHIPVLIIEGFGRRPLSSSAFEILSGHTNRNVCVFGVRPNLSRDERPEIFIPQPEAPPCTDDVRPQQERMMLEEMDRDLIDDSGFHDPDILELADPPHNGLVLTGSANSLINDPVSN